MHETISLKIKKYFPFYRAYFALPCQPRMGHTLSMPHPGFLLRCTKLSRLKSKNPAKSWDFQQNNCPLSTVHCQLSIVNCQLSIVNCPLSTVNCQLSTVNCHPCRYCLFGCFARQRILRPNGHSRQRSFSQYSVESCSSACESKALDAFSPHALCHARM